LLLQPVERNVNAEVLVLVVHAHPDPDSFNGHLARTAVESLRSAGHQVEFLDLYAEGFAAAMSQHERTVYESDAPIVDPMVRRHGELLLAAEAVVFVYPTWWWGLPAILKGWLERVLVPGVGFQLNEDNKVRGGLRNLRRVVGVTTYGSTKRDIALVNDAGRRIIMRCIRVLAPPLRCRGSWLGLYGMDRCTDADRGAFVEQVRSKMVSL
jgi:NAD(P)H dehydrogenase (quinone)